MDKEKLLKVASLPIKDLNRICRELKFSKEEVKRVKKERRKYMNRFGMEMH